MKRVGMPDERVLPPGPARELTRAVHELYRDAGMPSLRDVSAAIRRRDDLPATVSHERVRRILLGELTAWANVDSMVQVLAARSIHAPDVTDVRHRLHALWLAAEPEPTVVPDPALSTAIRALHGAPADDAVELLLRATLVVPRGASGGLLVSTTVDSGEWLCVFTTPERFAKHRAATGQPDSTWVPTTGRDLVRQVHGLGRRIGVLVDPRVDSAETLPVTPDLIAELCAKI
jgi:SseB protein N-terminal domain